MPSKSPAQAKLMRAVAHGWKPDRMKGPSRAVAREFVNADRKYSGGFAENRYWTGGLAAMNEINSGVPQTLNFRKGGKPKGYQFGGLYPGGGFDYSGWDFSQYTAPTTTTAPAPVAPTGETIASMYGDRYSATDPISGAAVMPYLHEQGGGVMGTDPIDMSQHKQSGPYGAMFTRAMEDGLTKSGYIEDPNTRIWYPWQPITDGGTGGGTGGGTTAPPPVRDIPGAAPQPGTTTPAPAPTEPVTPPQWTPEQIAAWNAQQTTSDRQSPYRDQLREHKARIAATLGTGNATGGPVAMDDPETRYFQRGGGRGRRGRRRAGPAGGGAGTRPPAPPPNTTVRDIPGAAPQPGSTTGPPGVEGGTAGTSIWSGIGGGGGIAGAVFGAAKQVFGSDATKQSQWTPAQIAAWQTTQERQSPYRDRLRAHKARAADLLKPGRMPSNTLRGGNIGGGPSPPYMPPVYGDKPEPGMAYAGGVPGWYSPGGPGYGGQLSGGGYGYEGDPSQPGYDDRSYEEFAAQQRITAPDITDEVLKARYEGRNANQGVIYTSGIGAAKGGYMNYQEGGAARPTPVEGGGAPVPGHQEGANPYTLANSPSRYRMWERRYHIDPPPPPPPPPPAEEPGFFSSLFGLGAAEEGKSRTERELEKYGEGMEQARGGYMRRYRSGGPVRRFQGGGLAQVSAPRGGVPPWVEPAGYMEPQGYQVGGRTQPWSGAQQQQWRGAAGNPAARQNLRGAYNSWSPEQRAGYTGRVGRQQAPQAAGRAGMMADSQRQQAALQQRAGMAGAQADYQQGLAAQRGAAGAAQPGMAYAGGTPGFYGPGGPGRGPSIGGGQGVLPGEGDLGNYRKSIYDRPFGNLRDQMSRQGTPPTPGGPGRWSPQQRTQWRGAGAAERGAMGQQNRQRQALQDRAGAGGITGGARVPPNMQGMLQKMRMQNRPPSNVGGGVNRVGQQDQQGALSRAMQRGTGRRPMSRRGGFPGGGMR